MTQINFLHPAPILPASRELMALRPYQEEAKTAILKQWAEGVKRTLLVLVTGRR